MNPDVRVIGVNPERSPWFHESLRQGKAIAPEPRDTIADAINDPVTEDMLTLVRETLDDVVLVSEEEIKELYGF